MGDEPVRLERGREWVTGAGSPNDSRTLRSTYALTELKGDARLGRRTLS